MKKVTGLLSVCLVFAAGCGQKAAETPAAAPATSSASAAATTTPAASADTSGVAECDAYMAAVEKYLKCANVPQAARDAQAQASKQMKASWASWASLPPDAKKMAQDTAKTSCTQALAALKQAASATGCPVD
jgi:hypothetical protein